MSVRPIDGFPLADDYAVTRVPNTVLGRVLAGVEDVGVIKLIFRAVWLLERQSGYPRIISVEQLRTDRVVSVVFGDASAFDRALGYAVECGILVRIWVDGVERLMLNTESARRASTEVGVNGESDEEDGWDSPAVRSVEANAFRAYEENIGVLSPMIRESILSSLEDFTDEEITEAIRIAVENESRSWSFVSGVLRRWAREGVPDEPRTKYPSRRSGERDVSQDQLNRYMEYLRRQQKRGSEQP